MSIKEKLLSKTNSDFFNIPYFKINRNKTINTTRRQIRENKCSKRNVSFISKLDYERIRNNAYNSFNLSDNMTYKDKTNLLKEKIIEYDKRCKKENNFGYNNKEKELINKNLIDKAKETITHRDESYREIDKMVEIAKIAHISQH